MTVHIYTAPAAAGKTEYVLRLVRERAHDLTVTPRVCASNQLQVESWKARLAHAGGSLGVRVSTFTGLYQECLRAAGEPLTLLAEPVQHRLLRAVLDDLPLQHYAPLRTKPGLISSLQRLIAELRVAYIAPQDFTYAVAHLEAGPRLGELAQVYAAYVATLQRAGWDDYESLGWRAVQALEQHPSLGRDWPLLVVDGFDNLTTTQVTCLQRLAGRVGELLITLTAAEGMAERAPLQGRFTATRARLQAALGVEAEPLPMPTLPRAPALAHLGATLFVSPTFQVEGAGQLEMIAAPDRAGEVRAALRWLKARLVQDGLQPQEMALLARSMAPYRPFIAQTAAEFGLPVRLVDGLPLLTNPAIMALLDLLRAFLPLSTTHSQPALPRRLAVEAWRSPYLDWGDDEAVGIVPGDAERLDTVARWGRVIGGLEQWRGALASLCALPAQPDDLDEESSVAGLAYGEEAKALCARFERFVTRLTPPADSSSHSTYVRWLESLIGPDSEEEGQSTQPDSLGIVARAREGDAATAQRDIAALRALKEVLRGMVWAEQLLSLPTPANYTVFFTELYGDLEAASYALPAVAAQPALLVADAIQARGLPFRVVALLGLAEGEFPATLQEDPLLRDADRRALGDLGVALDLPTQSAEAGYFYEALARPCERLLLTRPRLAENGVPWEPSPYWEEVCRLVQVQSQTLTSEERPPLEQVASWSELLESLAVQPQAQAAWQWAWAEDPQRCQALEVASDVLQERYRHHAGGPYDGDLSTLAGGLAQTYSAAYIWHVSRLEHYRLCPFYFYVTTVLGLQPRPEPEEGLDARQLGNVYHRLLRKVYRACPEVKRNHLGSLLAALEAEAGPVLDAAPAREGFRATAWWAETRTEIVANVRRSLQAFAEATDGFTPIEFEWRFPSFALPDTSHQDSLWLSGIIDRVDRAPDGRLRIIDYKTAGPSGFGAAIKEGKKLQLPLYALAAEGNWGGPVVDGFYWHVRAAEKSACPRDYPIAEAMRQASTYAWEVAKGVRAGAFMPQPAPTGCPTYCPAAAFCWHLRTGVGG